MEKTGQKRKQIQQRKNRDNAVSFAGASIRGFIATAICGLALLLISSFIAYSREDPEALSLPLALAALYIGCLVGGTVCMRTLKDGSAYGAALLAVAVLNAATLIVSSAVGNGGGRALWMSLLLRGSSFLFAVAGVFLGTQRSHGRKHRRH